MKYTWRLLIAAIIMVVNLLIFLTLDLGMHPLIVITLFVANLGVAWVVGFQLDKYVSSKKELGSTQSTLKEYAYALETVPLGIGISNELGKFEYVNKTFQKLYGYQANELEGEDWKNLCTEEIHDLVENIVAPEILKKGNWQGELMGVRKDKSSFPLEISLSTVEGTQKVIYIVRDITEQQQYIQYIKDVADQDDLTKLPNRRKLAADMREFGEGFSETAMLFIDLDRFKMINERLGHDYGDQILIHVSQRLSAFQEHDLNVYHLGGDEFIILMHDKDYEYIESTARQLIKQLKKPYLVNGKEVFLTASIGICLYPQHTSSQSELMKLADTAKYHAKLAGKNTVKFYNDDLKLQVERKSQIESELRKAISHNEFHIHYQPKCELVHGQLIGLEALLRWKNPVLGSVSPAEFIPVAEETGFMNDIGKWVIHEVLNQMQKWKSKGYPLVKVSVNVSQQQFKTNDLVNYIETCLAAHQIDARFFEIEITESLIADFKVLVPQLTALKDKGVGISIDDFGTGYSSLNFINDLPIDTLKIDQSFIRGMVKNEKNSLLLRAIIMIGESLELDVIAEGIETEEHLNQLKELNCPFGQGYYFSKPLEAQDIEAIYFNKANAVN